MGWTCLDCGDGDSSDNLDWPMTHLVLEPTHRVEPDVNTARRWAPLLGAAR